MPQHRRKTHRRIRIVRTVDIRRARLIRLIAHIRRRKPVRIRARVVRTPVPARVGRIRAQIRGDDPPHVGQQSGVRIVVVRADFARGGVPGHVGVDDREDGFVGGLVGSEDVAGAEQAGFFARVEVEFHGVARGVVGVCEHAQGFHDDDAAGGVVDGAGAAGGGGAAGGVEVGAYDDEVGGGAGDAGDDAGLGVGVRELRDGDAGVGGAEGFDGVEKVGCGLGPVGGFVVPIVETERVVSMHVERDKKELGCEGEILRQGLQPCLGSRGVELGNQAVGLGLMGYSRVCDGGHSSHTTIIFLTVEHAEDFWVFDIGDVDEVNAFPGVVGNLVLVRHPCTSIGWGGFDQTKALRDSGLEVGINKRGRCSYANAD